jgi:hypothetical protein
VVQDTVYLVHGHGLQHTTGAWASKLWHSCSGQRQGLGHAEPALNMRCL